MFDHGRRERIKQLKSYNNRSWIDSIYSRVFIIFSKTKYNFISRNSNSNFETLSRWRRFTCPTTSCLVSLTSTRKVTKKEKKKKKEEEAHREGREGGVKCLRATNWNPPSSTLFPFCTKSCWNLEKNKKLYRPCKSFTRSFVLDHLYHPSIYLYLSFSLLSFSLSFRRFHLTSPRRWNILAGGRGRGGGGGETKSRDFLGRKRRREAQFIALSILGVYQECLRFHLKNVALTPE